MRKEFILEPYKSFSSSFTTFSSVLDMKPNEFYLEGDKFLPDDIKFDVLLLKLGVEVPF